MMPTDTVGDVKRKVHAAVLFPPELQIVSAQASDEAVSVKIRGALDSLAVRVPGPSSMTLNDLAICLIKESRTVSSTACGSLLG
jgi:hypothetical protein